MDSGAIICRRNIVVLGNTGAGKSTVANHIVGEGILRVSDSVASQQTTSHVEVLRESDSVMYNIKVIDTVGFFDHKMTKSAVVKDIKKYFRDKVPEGLSLIIFVFKQGRFTPQEKAAFQFIISNFKEHTSQISALIITNCEKKNQTSRKRIVEEFQFHEHTIEIARFMKKGIHCVGFPPMYEIDEEVKPLLEGSIQKDDELLRSLVYSCGEMRPTKELFK